MGYFERLDPNVIYQLGKLGCLWYQEDFDEQPKFASIDEGEMTVTVSNGQNTAIYTFNQLFNEER